MYVLAEILKDSTKELVTSEVRGGGQDEEAQVRKQLHFVSFTI